MFPTRTFCVLFWACVIALVSFTVLRICTKDVIGAVKAPPAVPAVTVTVYKEVMQTIAAQVQTRQSHTGSGEWAHEMFVGIIYVTLPVALIAGMVTVFLVPRYIAANG